MNRSLRKVKFFWNILTEPKEVKPPYRHVCQIGDPVLRTPAEKVELKDISTPDVQNLIGLMVKTMRLYDACGISAPQIGMPLQIFAAELTERQARLIGPTLRNTQLIEPFPLKIFINPEMKIIDHDLLHFNEGCVSIASFQAKVSRFKEVLITGLNLKGEHESWQPKNWAARIAQHEFEHLQGILFTDKMDVKTLSLNGWHEVNRRRGRVKLSLEPHKQ